MNKTTLDLTYNELDQLLDSLLKKESLPSTVMRTSDAIVYQRHNKLWIIIKAAYRLILAEAIYWVYIQPRLAPLRKKKSIYQALKKTKCLHSLRTYLHLSKIGLTDLSVQLGGRFDDRVFAHFALATMLYDASFDVPECKRYLPDFDALIMQDQPIDSTDPFLSLFNNSITFLKTHLHQSKFERFANYVRIEHISQLMSIYQLSDKAVSRDQLTKITFAKGGIAALALMHLMAPQMKDQERGAIYEIGAVLQLIDDISDMEEDETSGIQTLANQRLLDIQELKHLYFGAVNNLIDQLGMDRTKSNGALDMLCWFADSMLERRYGALAKTN